jgi:hypothetical protein
MRDAIADRLCKRKFRVNLRLRPETWLRRVIGGGLQRGDSREARRNNVSSYSTCLACFALVIQPSTMLPELHKVLHSLAAAYQPRHENHNENLRDLIFVAKKVFDSMQKIDLQNASPHLQLNTESGKFVFLSRFKAFCT